MIFSFQASNDHVSVCANYRPETPRFLYRCFLINLPLTSLFFGFLMNLGMAQPNAVVVNGRAVSQQTLTQLGLPIPPGRYWYDSMCGAWGQEGGSTQGVIQPNLPLPGPLRRDASNGDSGVIINGREATRRDVMLLSQHLRRQVAPGRYSLGASGELKSEGAPTQKPLLADRPSSAPAEPPTSTARKEKGRYYLPGWNVSCKLPNDWHAQGERDRTYMLANTAGTGRMLVHRTFAREMSAVERSLAIAVRGLGLRVKDVQPLSVKRRADYLYGDGTYSAMDSYGRSYQLQASAVISPYETALVVLGGANAQSFEPVQSAVKEVIQSAEFGMPQSNNTRLVGTFYAYSGSSSGDAHSGGAARSSETFYTFDGRGNMSTNTLSHVSAYTGSHNSIGAPNAVTSSAHLNDNTPQKQASYRLIGEDMLIITWSSGRTTYNTVEIFSNGMKLNGATLIKK